MANEEHLAILKQGVEAWNKWREENPDMKPDLSEADLFQITLSEADLNRANLSNADLSEADLSWANLSRTDLYRANLDGVDLHDANLDRSYLRNASLTGARLIAALCREADLCEANLSGADLSRADLGGAHLIRANLSEADLSEADLREADLHNADLSRAHLRGTNLEGAIVGSTVLGDVNFSKVRGLETVTHLGPSTIGIDTIYRSNGKIPEVFLRGCGVPDNFIAYVGSLVGKAIEYYSCFISYSSKDQECAERLHNDLQAKGVRCWFAPEDLKIGDKFRTRIDEAIRYYDKLLIILSEHSIHSDWVESEVESAFEKESRHKRTVLFPIRVDDAVMETDQAWAADIRRTRHIGDFRGWRDHDKYGERFARLLRDLQAVDAQEVVAPPVARPPKTKATPTETYRASLRKNLVEWFNDSELRDLCFDLGVDYESLSGDNKADKARELVAYCERRQIVPDLVAKCKELRPKASWEGEYE